VTTPTAPPEMPKLGDFLCFAVYSANLAYGRAYKPILDELGLTYTQWIAIVALWEHDEQTVSGLGEKLFLESNAHAHPEEAGGARLPGAPARSARRAPGHRPADGGRVRVAREGRATQPGSGDGPRRRPVRRRAPHDERGARQPAAPHAARRRLSQRAALTSPARASRPRSSRTGRSRARRPRCRASAARSRPARGARP